MILWESIIAERQKPLKTQLIADPVKRNDVVANRARSLRYYYEFGKARFDADPERRERKRVRDRARYREIMADPELKAKYRAAQSKSRLTPKYRAYRAEYMREWRRKNPESSKAISSKYKASRNAERLNGEHTLYLMGGCIKVNMGRAA